MMELTFNLTEDRREPLKPQSLKDFELTFGNGSGVNVQSNNWVQGRLQMDNLRQTFVNIQQGKDNEPFDITGYILQFCGRTPFDGKQQSYRVIDNSSVVVDGLHGRFRYTFPAQAFAVAGTYKQAYFRLIRLSDYKCIATLEFDLSVLEDFVFADMVPSDYISPFNDILNQLLDGEKKFKADTQTLYEEAAKHLNDAVTQLTQLGTDVRTTLTTEQAALQQLIEKIKENNLLTQADLDKFSELIDSKLAELNKKITDLANSVEAIRQMGRNNAGLLQYKMVTVTTDPNGRNSVVTENQIKHLQAIHATMSIVDMVGITDKNDSNPQKSDGKLLQQAIAWSKQYNVPISMIKPHLGIDYWDNFYQADYMPTDVAGYFNAWGAILMKYAAICNENNIPILCLEVEQYLMTQNKYLDYWRTIIDNIRAKYPHLLLTAAYMSFEIVDDEHTDLLKYLDLIGMNMYPGYIIDDYSDKLTTSYLIQSFSNTIAGINNAKCIDQACEKFHKNAILTETGCIPTVKGLTQLVPDDFNSANGANNYEVTAFLMKAMFNFLKEDKNIIGFAWWHAGKPFNFFNETEDVANLSPAENVFKSSIEGGVI